MLNALRKCPSSMYMGNLKDCIDCNLRDLYPHDCVFKVWILNSCTSRTWVHFVALLFVFLNVWNCKCFSKDGHASEAVCGRRSCFTARHEAVGDHALSNTAVVHRVGVDAGWEQPGVQRSRCGEVIRPETLACDAYCTMLFDRVIHSPGSRGGVFTYSSALYILLVHCPVDQFLGFSWENIYHSAIYFLVGGTVCSYVCIQESTLQCNVTMCHFVCPCCCYAVAWCVSLPECLAAATAAHLCDVLCWSSYHAVS